MDVPRGIGARPIDMWKIHRVCQEPRAFIYVDDAKRFDPLY